MLQRLQHQIWPCPGAMRPFRQHPTPLPRPRLAGKQADHMAGNLAELATHCDVALNIGQHILRHLTRITARAGGKDQRISRGQHIRRLVICGTPDHHAIKSSLKKLLRLCQRGDATIDRQVQRWKHRFHLLHQRIIQRWDIPVLFWA